MITDGSSWIHDTDHWWLLLWYYWTLIHIALVLTSVVQWVFRFIASFHTYDWNFNMHMVWSHFESAHGKDLSDPECGSAKYILRCHEMRHTADVPTELKSSLDQYKHLKSHHTGKLTMFAVLCSPHWVVVGTNRTFRQKKRKGIYCRVYHWMPSKKIRPLCTLAEVGTLPGSCTMESHFFANAQDCSKIYVKRLACFNCNSCRCHRYRQWLMWTFSRSLRLIAFQTSEYEIWCTRPCSRD